MLLRDHPLVRLLFRHEWWLSLLFFFGAWAVFLIHSQTLTSGYHLIDDHEMLKISQDLQTQDPFTVSAKWINLDILARFRPMYYVHRTFSLWFLGTSFTALSILLLVMAALTSWFLYLFARKIGYRQLSAGLFAALTFLGAQTAIWWRLGPSESIGIFWLALGLLFMAKAVYDQAANKLRNTIIALISIVLASLSKEAFVVLLPAVMFWWLWLYLKHNHASWRNTITKHLPHIISLAIICVVELAIIFLKVGTTGIGYAGADAESLGLRRILGTWKYSFTLNNPELLVVLSLIALATAGAMLMRANGTLRERFQKHRDHISNFLYAGTLVAMWTGSQAVLYAKSGIYERYMIPGSVGFAFMVIFLLLSIKQLLKPRLLRDVVLIALLVLAAATLIRQYPLARLEAKQFTHDGIELNQAFNKLISTTDVSHTVLIVADPAYDFEASLSTETFLTLQAKYQYVYFLPLWSRESSEYSQFLTELGSYYTGYLINTRHVDQLADKRQIDAIFTYTGTDAALQAGKPEWLPLGNFTRDEFGKFVVYSTD